MEEQIKTELQRAKMTNNILKKQNEMLMGTITNLSKEKEELLKKIEEMNQKQNENPSFSKKVARKVKNIIKK